MTALHWFADNGLSLNTIEKLLKLRLDPSAVDDWGNRSYHYAKDFEVRKLLFDVYISSGSK